MMLRSRILLYRSRQFFIPALALWGILGCESPSDAPAPVTGSGYVSGSTYFGTNQYIEYFAGDMPLIMTVPHGGDLQPSTIPNRTWGSIGKDGFTQEVSRLIRDSLITTGRFPHVIINRLARVKLDANRPVEEAAQGNALAVQAWQQFHAFIQAAKDTIVSRFGRGILIDLHGHGHVIQRIELGYLLLPGELSLSDSTLNTTQYVMKTSVRNLATSGLFTLSQILRGQESLGNMLTQRGYQTVPSSDVSHPGSDPYFFGEYNTYTHGSKFGGTIDAIQLELNNQGIRDSQSNAEIFAGRFSTAIIGFLDTHY